MSLRKPVFQRLTRDFQGKPVTLAASPTVFTPFAPLLFLCGIFLHLGQGEQKPLATPPKLLKGLALFVALFAAFDVFMPARDLKILSLVNIFHSHWPSLAGHLLLLGYAE